MAKWCNVCGRKKHKGLCDMATLSDNRIVHVSRLERGGDLHDEIGSDLKVKNRWIKKDQLKEKNK